MDEALDKDNLRVTNPREILDNKMTNECPRHGMMKTTFLPMGIHEESPLHRAWKLLHEHLIKSMLT
jgi:hypothetical protein